MTHPLLSPVRNLFDYEDTVAHGMNRTLPGREVDTALESDEPAALPPPPPVLDISPDWACHPDVIFPSPSILPAVDGCLPVPRSVEAPYTPREVPSARLAPIPAPRHRPLLTAAMGLALCMAGIGAVHLLTRPTPAPCLLRPVTPS